MEKVFQVKSGKAEIEGRTCKVIASSFCYKNGVTTAQLFGVDNGYQLLGTGSLWPEGKDVYHLDFVQIRF